MTPQSTFLIAAPICAGRETELRALLGTMNRLPGFADPRNALVPFGKFDTIHFARFVILDDPTSGDLAVYATSFPDAPLYLAFIAD